VLPKQGIIHVEMEQGHKRNHLVAGRDDAPCWTLFMHKAGSVKPWGFWRDLCDPNYPDAAVFEPYQYTREGSQKDWWLTAKSRGKA